MIINENLLPPTIRGFYKEIEDLTFRAMRSAENRAVHAFVEKHKSEYQVNPRYGFDHAIETVDGDPYFVPFLLTNSVYQKDGFQTVAQRIKCDGELDKHEVEIVWRTNSDDDDDIEFVLAEVDDE